MKYEINREDTTMKTKYKTHVRAEKKSGRCHVGGLALAALLAFGFAVPAHALYIDYGVIDFANNHDMSSQLATIRVPVKLHHLPSVFYRVKCKVYDRSHRILQADGMSVSGGAIPSSGELDTTASIGIFPLKTATVHASQLSSWQCFLSVNGKDSTSGLTEMHKSGTRYASHVGGNF